LYNFKKGCRLIRASKIVLSDSGWPYADGFISDRLFHSLVAGNALVMQQYFTGYERLGLVDGRHFVLWKDTEDLLKQLPYWLSAEASERRTAIAKAGEQYILENFSYSVRIEKMLKMIGAIKEGNAGHSK